MSAADRVSCIRLARQGRQPLRFPQRQLIRIPAMFRVLLFAILSLLSLGAQAIAQPVVVGYFNGNAPWEFVDDKGVLAGFEIDILREAARRVGVEVEFHPSDFPGLFEGIRSEEFQIAIGSIAITPQRAVDYTFSQPYFDSDNVLIAKSNSGIVSSDDLVGRRLGALSGSMAIDWLRTHGPGLGVSQVREYTTAADMITEIANGGIDGGITEFAVGLYHTRDRPDVQPVLRIVSSLSIGMIMGSELVIRPVLRDTLNQMKLDGTMAKIHEKWFGRPPREGTSTVTVR
jgi:polar amino acid transport system substrate-binding protein